MNGLYIHAFNFSDTLMMRPETSTGYRCMVDINQQHLSILHGIVLRKMQLFVPVSPCQFCIKCMLKPDKISMTGMGSYDFVRLHSCQYQSVER
jgi:hypothetical protein